MRVKTNLQGRRVGWGDDHDPVRYKGRAHSAMREAQLLMPTQSNRSVGNGDDW